MDATAAIEFFQPNIIAIENNDNDTRYYGILHHLIASLPSFFSFKCLFLPNHDISANGMFMGSFNTTSGFNFISNLQNTANSSAYVGVLASTGLAFNSEIYLSEFYLDSCQCMLYFGRGMAGGGQERGVLLRLILC